jgi:hypothetical protein
MFYAAKRQRYLVDQGYAFLVLREPELAAHYAEMETPDLPPYQLRTKADQLQARARALMLGWIRDAGPNEQTIEINIGKCADVR